MDLTFNNFTIIYFFPEHFIHLDLVSVLLALEIGIAVSAQSSCIILFVTVDALVSKHFATIKTVTILAHAFGKMLTVFMRAVLVDHYRW